MLVICLLLDSLFTLRHSVQWRRELFGDGGKTQQILYLR